MEIAGKVEEVRKHISAVRSGARIIGFVPTMGALHDGHISLVRASKKESDYTVVSIFVNPAQFGEGEDLDKYPRDFEKDRSLLEKEGVDLVFFPDAAEIYPAGFDTWIVPGEPAVILEGERRPGHFRGVCTVVMKLFQIVQPDKAFFGQKDAQQFVVLNRMVKDLNIPVKMYEMPIIRHKDNLAMSSRNAYLNADERKAAPVFYSALCEAEKMIKEGSRDRRKIIDAIKKYVELESMAHLDYAEIVDARTFTIAEELKDDLYICIAGFIGNTRLIDNIRVRL